MKTFNLLLLLSAICVSCSQKVDTTIRVYPTQKISTNYIGNGVQWDAYPHADTENGEWGKLMSDEKWQMNFDRLDYMKPKLFRVLDQANWRYMVGFNQQGEPILNFDTPEIEALEKILDYAQKNNITVMLGEWGTPFKMHDTDAGHSDKFTGADDPLWIDAIVQYLDYLINTKGYTCIKYFNLINEPNGGWASTKGDFNEWSSAAKQFAQTLKENNLDSKVTLAGPDAVTRYDNPNSQYTGAQWVEETAKQLDDIVGIYEVHDYTSHELVKAGGFKDYHGNIAKHAHAVNKQIIFGELGFSRNGQRNQDRATADPYASEDSQMEVYDFSYGIFMADALIQSMNAGYSGTAAWALDDAMHTLGDEGDKNQLKRWGMWNSLGTELCNNPADEEIRPWFYPWSLLCRYIPTGSSVIQTDQPTVDGLRLTATTYQDNITIAIINNSDEATSLELIIPTAQKMKQYIYSEESQTVDANGFPTAVDQNFNINKNIKLNIPKNSFMLLTSLTR